MKKLFCVLLFFVLLPTSAWGACTGSSPTWTCGSWSDLKTCIESSAIAGDTINVSAGSYTANSTITIDKELHIIGAGAGSSTITKTSSGAAFLLYPIPQSSNPEIEISGFTFDIGNSAAGIYLWKLDEQVTSLMNKANIHECTFTGKTVKAEGEQEYIASWGMGGVVWKCTFSGAWQYFRGFQVGDESYLSVFDTALGTANALYFEDCIFNNTGNVDEYMYDCQFGGLRVTWRYNTYNISNTSTDLAIIDWHEYNNSAYSACQGHLLYGNNIIFTNNGSTYAIAQARGGRSIVAFNNVSSTNSTQSLGWASGDYGCPTSYTDHQLVRAYAWSNLRNLSTNDIAGWDEGQPRGTCDGSSDYPDINWNLFNYNTTETGSSQTTGVRCGTLANRPTTCSNRVAYFAITSGSCTDLTGYVGDIVNNPTRGEIEGTLYVCGSSNNWSEWWTPYEYPHPLRGEGSTTTTQSAQGCVIKSVSEQKATVGSGGIKMRMQ